MVEWSTLARLVKQSTAMKAYFAYPLPVGINAMRSTSYMENGHDKEFTVSFLGGMWSTLKNLYHLSQNLTISFAPLCIVD